MKLLTGPLSMFGTKARIAVAEKNAPCGIEYVPFSLKTRYNPLHPDVARLNPKGQVPVLLDGEVEIFDSTQIFEYLEEKFPEPPLWPRSTEARAMARLMELKADEIYFPNVIVLINAAADISRPECKEALKKMAAYYRDMDARLAAKNLLPRDIPTPISPSSRQAISRLSWAARRTLRFPILRVGANVSPRVLPWRPS